MALYPILFTYLVLEINNYKQPNTGAIELCLTYYELKWKYG